MTRKLFAHILAGLALALGLLHIAYGFYNYPKINLEMMWFVGSGIGIVTTALATFSYSKLNILRVQNALMTAFLIGLVIMAPLPQVWIGLGLFAGLFVLSLIAPSPSSP